MTNRDALAELHYHVELIRAADTLSQVGSSAYRLGQLCGSGSLTAAVVIKALFDAATEREDADPDVVYKLLEAGLMSGLKRPAAPRVAPAVEFRLL